MVSTTVSLHRTNPDLMEPCSTLSIVSLKVSSLLRESLPWLREKIHAWVRGASDFGCSLNSAACFSGSWVEEWYCVEGMNGSAGSTDITACANGTNGCNTTIKAVTCFSRIWPGRQHCVDGENCSDRSIDSTAYLFRSRKRGRTCLGSVNDGSSIDTTVCFSRAWRGEVAVGTVQLAVRERSERTCLGRRRE
jgi:hypothetical protein